MKKDKLVQSLLIRQTLLRKSQNDLKATQIYLIVLPNRRQKFPKMEKKKFEISKIVFLVFPPSWIYSFQS